VSAAPPATASQPTGDPPRNPRFWDSLLARSFLLITLLLLLSLGGWFQIYRAYQREPIAREIAQQMTTIINLTRAAIVNSDPRLRRELLLDLNETEDIRVYAGSPDEKLAPVPSDVMFDLIGSRIKAALGPRTRLAFARNGIEGYWVSFNIDDDEFWVKLERERLEPDFATQWIGWGLFALLLSLVGAWAIASRISRPLNALTRAAQQVGRGERVKPAPEKGPAEIRMLAAAFNQMSADLATLERDRAMVLAGISHDLRTPLARLRLGLEMVGGDPAMSEALAADIEEMDKIIGQFLDFAKGESETRIDTDLDALVAEICERYAKLGRGLAHCRTEPMRMQLAQMAVRRAISNLIDNALRYSGGSIEVEARAEGDYAIVEVRDRGPGIPPAEAERMKRPFTRLEEARSGTGGSGLGLAIVDRVVRMHGGMLELLPREGGGLTARMTFPMRGAPLREPFAMTPFRTPVAPP
jgi:two-component system osmolarity sensor histidine kinase EnvZ